MQDSLIKTITDNRAIASTNMQNRLGVIGNKLTKLTEDFQVSGKIYSSEILEIIGEFGKLLKDSTQHIQLDHLARVGVQTPETSDV